MWRHRSNCPFARLQARCSCTVRCDECTSKQGGLGWGHTWMLDPKATWRGSTTHESRCVIAKKRQTARSDSAMGSEHE